MQAGEELRGFRRWIVETANRVFRYPALLHNWIVDKAGAHKQVANRYLEPWMWCVQCFSATDVNNLLLLRNHPDAEPNFWDLARQMQAQVDYIRTVIHKAQATSEDTFRAAVLGIEHYQILKAGEWHLPYVTQEEYRGLVSHLATTLSAARCANTSYTMPGDNKKIDLIAAQAIEQKLFGGKIKHLSPCEHQAMATDKHKYFANFKSWKQYRLTIAGQDGGDR